MKSYIKDYPRMQFVRDSWANLNGKWDFAFDDDNIGEAQRWFQDFPRGKDIEVPFSYETELSGIHDETIHNHVWYQKEFQVDRLSLNEKRLQLHFEGCDYVSKVWVNGAFVGSHVGGYTRFSFDITDYTVDGVNYIVVKAEDSLTKEQPRGKQRWLENNFACWYVQTTGIWKTVWLEYVPIVSVDKVKMTPNIEDKQLQLNFEVQAKNYSPDLAVEIEISFKDEFINKVIVPIEAKYVSAAINVQSNVFGETGICMWSPEDPNLYDITFTLKEGERKWDRVLSYFGMREIRIDGNQILLNNNPYYQRLILDQGYWEKSHLTPPSEEALIEDVDKIKQLGYNGLRKHQKTEDERFLYWCDVKGMIVWGETPATYEYSDEAVKAFTIEWMDIVKQNYNHPCIIIWTPFNESWGVDNIKHDPSQQKFTEAIYYLTKAYDIMRPVVLNDGWEHTISDIITLHDYEQEGDVLYQRYSQGKEAILSNEICHDGSHYAFADGYSYKGQPVMVTEFGGVAFDDENTGWGYGAKVKGEEDFIRRFDAITTAIKKLSYVCGYCYTQVTDVQQEINGLMDEKRNFKVDPTKICEINLAE